MQRQLENIDAKWDPERQENTCDTMDNGGQRPHGHLNLGQIKKHGSSQPFFLRPDSATHQHHASVILQTRLSIICFQCRAVVHRNMVNLVALDFVLRPILTRAVRIEVKTRFAL